MVSVLHHSFQYNLFFLKQHRNILVFYYIASWRNKNARLRMGSKQERKTVNYSIQDNVRWSLGYARECRTLDNLCGVGVGNSLNSLLGFGSSHPCSGQPLQLLQESSWMPVPFPFEGKWPKWP